jgi:hypothetical protein
MLKKRLLALGFSLVLALGVAACNGGEFEEAPNDQSAPEAPADDTLDDDGI